MDNLLLQISKKTKLNNNLISAVKDNFELIELKKGDIILSEGQRARHIFFVEKGVLHTYYYHVDKQVTSWFYSENNFITAWSSFYTQKASYEEIKCLENCTLYKLSYERYQFLIQNFPDFANFARCLAEEMLAFLDEYSKGMFFMSAHEKYNLLLNYFPGIELRVKLGLIASFLGISQETLSRVRSKN